MSLFRKEVKTLYEHRLHGDVVFTQPLSAKLFTSALFIIIAIASVWVSLGAYARTETVPGILVTSMPSAKVMAMQSGVVVDLHVSEGELVERGDVLLVIDSDRQAAGGGDVAGRGLGALQERRALTETQVALAGSRAAAERARLSAIIASSENEAESISEQIILQEQLVASNQQIFDRVAQVVERGFVSKLEFESRRQTLLSAQQSLASLKQRHTASLSEAAQARSQLATVNINAAQGISRIQDNLQAIAAEQARLEGEQSYLIKAPIAGRVTALGTGQGRAATNGRPLMVIVPANAELTAELYAPTRAIGFVEPGTETRLLYDAFPYPRFGSFAGTVSSISRIAIDPNEAAIPFSMDEPVYRIKVDLHDQDIRAFGRPAPLQPGMTLQANIVLERQTFLAWLLQPLNAVLNRT